MGRTLSAKTTALTAVNIGTAHIRSPTTRPGRRWQHLQRSLRCHLGLGNRPTLIVVHGRSSTDDRQSCLAVDSTVTVSTPAPSNAVLPSNVSDIPPLFGQEPLTKKAMGPCPPPSPFASLVRAAVIATDLVSPWRTRLTRAGPSSSDRGGCQWRLLSRSPVYRPVWSTCIHPPGHQKRAAREFLATTECSTSLQLLGIEPAAVVGSAPSTERQQSRGICSGRKIALGTASGSL